MSTNTRTKHSPEVSQKRKSSSRSSLGSSRDAQWGILGNRAVIDRLKRMLQHGLHAHALLLTGPRGVGKALLATSLTNALICTRQVDGVACGDCVNCSAFAAHMHPDVVLFPSDDERIGIDHVRALTNAFHQRPILSERHVAFIDRIERMTEEASNAFLKTLEEPSGNSVFILTSSNLRSVPLTIISRCALFHISISPEVQIAEQLKTTGLDARTSRQIAAFSDGRSAYAQFLAAQPTAYDQAREESEQFLTMLMSPTYERIRLAETIASRKEDASKVLNILERWESVVRRMGKIACGMTYRGPESERLTPIVHNHMTTRTIVDIMRSLINCRTRIQTSGNVRLNIESFALHLPQLHI